MYENQMQSRKWQLTIDNPQDHGMTHDEIGASGTHHTHVYLYSSSLTTPQALQAFIPNRM